MAVSMYKAGTSIPRKGQRQWQQSFHIQSGAMPVRNIAPGFSCADIIVVQPPAYSCSGRTARGRKIGFIAGERRSVQLGACRFGGAIPESVVWQTATAVATNMPLRAYSDGVVSPLLYTAPWRSTRMEWCSSKQDERWQIMQIYG
jgi:hypothetical protein